MTSDPHGEERTILIEEYPADGWDGIELYWADENFGKGEKCLERPAHSNHKNAFP